MNLLRVGLVMLLGFRIFLLWPKLRQRFGGRPLPPSPRLKPCEFRVIRGGRRLQTIEAVQIGLVVPDRLRFRVQPETRFDIFAKAIGIAREWQTDDDRFDERVFLLSDDPVLLEALSRNVRLRESVLTLMRAPFSAVLRCSHGRLWVEIATPDSKPISDESIATEVAQRVLPALQAVRNALSTVESDIWKAKRDPGIRIQAALLTLTFLLGVAGAAAFFWHPTVRLPRQIVFEGIVFHSIWTSATCLAALVAAAIFLLRRSSRTHWVLLEILLVGGPALWFISYGAAISLNQQNDRSRPTVQDIRVVHKYYTTGRRKQRTHYIVVQKWPDLRADPILMVYQYDWDALEPPTCVRVEWHRGYLGDPWIAAFRRLGHDCPGGPVSPEVAE